MGGWIERKYFELKKKAKKRRGKGGRMQDKEGKGGKEEDEGRK